jgi:hypothetical protein
MEFTVGTEDAGMKVAILVAIIAGTVTSVQAFSDQTTVCRSYSDGVFSFVECADGTHIVLGPGGERRVYRAPNTGFECYPGQPQPPVFCNGLPGSM